MSRKRILFAVLLGVLALSVGYAYLAMPRLQKAPPRSADFKTSRNQNIAAATRAGSGARINFSYLEPGSQKFPGAERNIFAFEAAPVVNIMKPVVKQHIPKPPVVVKPPVAIPTPIETVQKSLSQFTFLGFLDKGGNKTVFLSSGGNLFLVKQGESFGENLEFYVNSIEENLLKVRHKDSSSLIEVPLIEKKKLSAAVSAPARLPQSPPLPPINRTRKFVPIESTGGNTERQLSDPAENEKSFRELIFEKYNPENEQEEKPVSKDNLEGEVNGANQ